MTSGCDDRSWLQDTAISAMVPEDLDEVMAIERHAFPSAWSRASYERELRSSSCRYFAARCRGDLVGYAGMWVVSDEAHITTLAVHPARRRQGLGARLVRHLMAVARREGASRMSLEVRTSNHAAQALYRKFGFQQKGMLTHYYGDTGENGLVMWKPLSPGSGRERAQ